MCKWDRDAKDYLIDGEPCRRDDYGDPTHHCTARRTCSVHIGADERTCARCIGRVRANLKHIPALGALMVPVALTSGVNSQAANLAGPAADPEEWSTRRIAMRSHLAAWERLGRITERQHFHARSTMEDDDEQHPLNVLGRWARMIAEDYGHDLPRLSVSRAADYLSRMLPRIAQDPEQDFPLLSTDLRNCRRHMEVVVATAAYQERGVPCPDCEGKRPRLVKHYGHWCDDEACEQIHRADDSEDVWVCPRDRDHWWTETDYRLRVADWYDETTNEASA